MTTPPPLNSLQRKKLAILNQQKILILGAGREGISTYKFLRFAFPTQTLTVADRLPLSKLNPFWQKITAHDPYFISSFGKHYLNHLSDFNYIFKTPGIPPSLPPLQQALNSGSHLTSNTEWFLRLARGQIIGVTGTKGKSTTSSLLAHALTVNGKPVLLLGNIGTPALSYVTQTTPKTIIILELSAHQLQHLPFSPHFAIVQNITSEHLDYYPNQAAYLDAKTAIVKYQNSKDFLIYSDDFKTSRHFATLTPATKLCYGLHNHLHHLAFATNRAIFYRPTPSHLPQSILDRKKIKLLGKHNLYNLMPALILAKHFSLTNEQIATSFYSFSPLKHRLEYVNTVNKVLYYNDSLSTTPQATIAALKTFPHTPIHLLVGGFERHQNFTTLASLILRSPVKSVILFAPTGKRLKRTLIELAIKKKKLVPDFYDAKSMPQAVRTAHLIAQTGDIVLLSPAAASFGNFQDYADRGNKFCAAVKNLL
jgi:UDP-N-acetylmuramoylalanine--D-glutamate ligase